MVANAAAQDRPASEQTWGFAPRLGAWPSDSCNKRWHVLLPVSQPHIRKDSAIRQGLHTHPLHPAHEASNSRVFSLVVSTYQSDQGGRARRDRIHLIHSSTTCAVASIATSSHMSAGPRVPPACELARFCRPRRRLLVVDFDRVAPGCRPASEFAPGTKRRPGSLELGHPICAPLTCHPGCFDAAFNMLCLESG